MQIIAEVKTESPFGFRSSKSWDELFEIAEHIGDIISVHTDARWGGSFALLEHARAMTKKPILAKGLHESDAEVQAAVALGADWVLVVGRVPEHNLARCIIEPFYLADLSTIPSLCKVVWNSRDLKTGELKKETFPEARKQWSGWLCQASNIHSIRDIDKTADAVLIGEHLPEIASEFSLLTAK